MTRTRDWWGSALLQRGGDDEVWAWGSHAVTHAGLREAVARLAARFEAAGVGPGASVVLRLPPSLTLIQSMLALWSLGSQVILADVRLKPSEVARTLDLLRPTHQVHSTDAHQPFTPFRDRCEVLVERLPEGSAAVADVVLVQLSSGSTGLPKVIGRSAESLLSELRRHADIAGMPGPGERVLVLSSIIHAFGLMAGVLHALRVGAQVVFADRLQPDDLLHRARTAEVAVILGVPAHFDLLARASGEERMPRLRVAASAGEALTAAVRQRFLDRYGVRLGQEYGMTEVGVIAADLRGEHPTPSVGTLAPGIEAHSVGGELRVRLERSPYLYAEGSDRHADGWLRTCDRGELDPVTGALRLAGRTDSLVAVGGLKVDLGEVEAALREHAGVRDLVVVFGDGIEAHVEAEPSVDATALMAWCRERLSDYKLPRRIYLVPAIPRNATGKLLRNRDLLHAAYDGSGPA
ncbi:AMP-binding protein [Micromonospora sp. NBC_01740]|uniref:class I adenylate-forming enzyme family protein n=1 Tax=Micromonospora sp. NBC_01740 TaxID=2975986 RepID=UPI002E1567B6|nr:AMP-binding protein [Micromonospora sp. NBC_01740]